MMIHFDKSLKNRRMSNVYLSVSDHGGSVVSNIMVNGSNPAEDMIICFVLSYLVMIKTSRSCHMIYSRKLSDAFETQRLCNLSGQTEEYHKRPIRITDVRAVIRTWDLPITKQDLYPLNCDVRWRTCDPPSKEFFHLSE
jgi:hypothetical protein